MTGRSQDGPVVLVVEDELLIAASLELALELRGYCLLGPTPTVAGALELLEHTRPDVALIDYRLSRSTTEPLLEVFDRSGIPVCVLTGFGREQLPASYAHRPILEKPFGLNHLMRVLGSIAPPPSAPSPSPPPSTPSSSPSSSPSPGAGP